MFLFSPLSAHQRKSAHSQESENGKPVVLSAKPSKRLLQKDPNPVPQVSCSCSLTHAAAGRGLVTTGWGMVHVMEGHHLLPTSRGRSCSVPLTVPCSAQTWSLQGKRGEQVLRLVAASQNKCVNTTDAECSCLNSQSTDIRLAWFFFFPSFFPFPIISHSFLLSCFTPRG